MTDWIICQSGTESYDFLMFILKHFIVFSENCGISLRYDENNCVNIYYSIYKNEKEINTEKEEEFITSPSQM